MTVKIDINRNFNSSSKLTETLTVIEPVIETLTVITNVTKTLTVTAKVTETLTEK